MEGNTEFPCNVPGTYCSTGRVEKDTFKKMFLLAICFDTRLNSRLSPDSCRMKLRRASVFFIVNIKARLQMAATPLY